jgi:cytochrome d ubiquinol oxidase subunit II
VTSLTNLGNLWFVIDAIFWVGFFILEGFDFGVGMLHSFVGRTEHERRLMVNTVGPVWDGNEVWLIVAGAVIFAAFPAWYATMFSSLYLALLLVLVALMVRGVSFEYRRKNESAQWRATFRWTLTIGSALIPLLIGVALGDLLHGLPINSSHEYTGSFWDLLTAYGIYAGITLVVMCLVMGLVYLKLKTTGDLHERISRLTPAVGWLGFLVVWGFVTWTHVGLGKGFVPNIFEVIAFVGALAVPFLARSRWEGLTFLAACVGMGGTVATFFAELYPRVMVSSTSSANNLTIANSASPSYTLRVMTVVALIFFPVVLIYQGWTYHVFRRRLRSPRVGSETLPATDTGPVAAAPAGPTPALVADGDGDGDGSGPTG